jgi:hypothetical protein
LATRAERLRDKARADTRNAGEHCVSGIFCATSSMNIAQKRLELLD